MRPRRHSKQQTNQSARDHEIAGGKLLLQAVNGISYADLVRSPAS